MTNITLNFNVTGEDRKRLVKLIGYALETKPRYLGAPTFAYAIGGITISRYGEVTLPNYLYNDMTRVFAESEFSYDGGIDEPTETAAEIANEPMANLTAADGELPTVETHDEPMDTTAPTVAEDRINIHIPRAAFTDTALDNLDALLASKGRFICKAFDIKAAEYTLSDEWLTFKWFHGEIDGDKATAYRQFVGLLCDMAQKLKRVTSKIRAVENERYAFRCFLLRLGMIGNEYKISRRVLLKNLDGDAAFKTGRTVVVNEIPKP